VTDVKDEQVSTPDGHYKHLLDDETYPNAEQPVTQAAV